jgi:Phage integrase family
MPSSPKPRFCGAILRPRSAFLTTHYRYRGRATRTGSRPSWCDDAASCSGSETRRTLRHCSAKPWKSPSISRRSCGNCAPLRALRACGPRRAAGTRLAICSRQSIAGSPRRQYLDQRSNVGPEASLFLSGRDTPLPIRSIQAIIGRLAARAHIERVPVSAHTLRHTFALSFLRANPGKLVELASLLGHDSLDTTALYTRPSADHLAADVERSPLNVDR